RVNDRDLLVDIALNAEHKDSALAAFDRVVGAGGGTDLVLVRSIEAKTAQKAVAKRAKTLIQEAEAARIAAEEDRRRREAAVCEGVEGLVEVNDVAAARAEMARLSHAWAALD